MATPPDVKISQFDINVDPSGFRHLESPANGFQQTLGVAAGEFLNLSGVDRTNGKQSSQTKVFLMRVDNFNDANEAVFNMRFYLSSVSDFTTGTFSFNGFASGRHITGATLTDASGLFIPTALPSGQNLWRAADGPFDPSSASFQEITGVGSDDQVTMYQYLSVTVDTDVPAGVYGGNTGGFTGRITWDYR